MLNTWNQNKLFIICLGKEVVKRWVNIWDAFNKSTKKEKLLNKFGAGASIIKKYVYAEQLKFLSKVFCPRSTVDSLSINSGNEDTEPTVSENDNRNESEQFKIPPRKQRGSRKRKMDEVDMRILKALEEAEYRHISFFKRIVPTLHTFTEDETVNFQMGVLQLLTNIKHDFKHKTHTWISILILIIIAVFLLKKICKIMICNCP